MKIRQGAIFAVGICSLVLFAGCLANKSPLSCRDLSGRAAEISRIAEDKGSILLEGDNLYGRGIVRITPSTSFFRKVSSGWERVNFSYLREGEWIEVCGPVMESYPVQVIARQVVIRDAP